MEIPCGNYYYGYIKFCIFSPTTSLVESASKPQEDPFVRPYYKGNVKEPSLDYATIEYVDSEILSPRPVKQQIKQDPFKYVYSYVVFIYKIDESFDKSFLSYKLLII